MNNNVIKNVDTLIEASVKITKSVISQESSWVRYRTTVRNSTIDRHVFIGFRGFIEWSRIQHHSLIASKVSLLGKPGNEVTIGPYCWIGAGAVIEAGVTVGEGAIIGAGSHVKNDIPPYFIAVGRECHLLKKRKCQIDEEPNFSTFLHYVRSQMVNSLKSDFHYQVGKQCYITADVVHGKDLVVGDETILIGQKVHGQDGGLIFGDNVSIGKNVIIEGAGGINVGNGVAIEDDVILLSTTHRYELLSAPMVKTPLVIEDGVTVKQGSIVIGGIKLGLGSTVSPHSVVIKSVLSATKVDGAPATLLEN